MKLFDSEWKVMEVLWQENDLTAKEVSLRLAESIGWNKNTTYTVLKKCIDKGAIERREPNFVCHAAITKAQVLKSGLHIGLTNVHARIRLRSQNERHGVAITSSPEVGTTIRVLMPAVREGEVSE